MDGSQWVIPPDSGKAIRSPPSGEARVSLLIAITLFALRGRPVPRLFVFWHNCFPRFFYHLDLSWFSRKDTDLKCLHSKCGCHLCSCYHCLICSGLFFNTILWFDLALKICNTAPRQAPWKKSITTHACTNSVAFLLMIHHAADCIYKGRLSF